MVAHDVGDALLARRQDVEPEQHGPEAVLLAHVVRAGAGAFLAADGGHAGVEQVAEELPAGRGLVDADVLGRGYAVGGAAGRHRAGDAGQALAIAGRQMGVGGERREAVGRRHEEAAADDEVAVAVPVRGRAKVGRVRRHGEIVDALGMDEVRVGVVAAEVGQGRAVDHRARLGAERAFEDLCGIRARSRPTWRRSVMRKPPANMARIRSKSNNCSIRAW